LRWAVCDDVTTLLYSHGKPFMSLDVISFLFTD
jgi:hypothetical protein